MLLFASRCLAACNPARRRPSFNLAEAQLRFHWEREHLEARFVDLARVAHNRGTPRWENCDFDDAVVYAWNRRTGRLSAWVAITVTLIDRKSVAEDSAMRLVGHVLPDDTIVPLEESLRSGTAVFAFDGNHWTTDASALFNLSPTEAIRFYRHDLQVVGQNDSGLNRRLLN